MKGSKEVASPCGWSARHRPWGDSFTGCLLCLVLVIGGAAWWYFHFFRDRELVHPLHGLTVVHGDNSEQLNNYREQVLQDPWPKSNYDAKYLVQFIRAVRAGKEYKDPSAFNQKAGELDGRLRSTMHSIKDRAIPAKYFQAHKMMALGVANLYQSLNALRTYYSAKTKQVKEQAWKKCVREYEKGRQRINECKTTFGSV